MKRVTGLGGIFFRCKEPQKITQWYAEHLGLNVDEYGTAFEWRLSGKPEEIAYTQWSPFQDTTDYFDPSKKEFMINYRVENIEKLVGVLRQEGVNILDEISSYEYGKFVHIMDPEGNKIELWEPVDSAFTSIAPPKTTK